MTDLNLNADIDKSGDTFQWERVWCGPTLGWQFVPVKGSIQVTTAGAHSVPAGIAIVFVNVAGLVTINLPDINVWVQMTQGQPPAGFERAIYIKDLGGNAAANNITVAPFAGQKIDNLAQNFTIVQNRQLLRLYPLNDRTGWFSG